jgi:hypothetical protein
MSEDNDYEGLEDEWSSPEDEDPCELCGPWCSDWGGDGICMVVIREQVKQRRDYMRRHFGRRKCPECGEVLDCYNVLAKEIWTWSPEWYDPIIGLEIFSAYGVPKGVLHSKGALYHVWIGTGENRREELIRLISEDKKRKCTA